MKSQLILYENVKHGTEEFPLQVYEVPFEDGFALYPHLHQEYEFLIMDQGDGYVYIDEREYYLRQGEGVFVPANHIHSGRPGTSQKAHFFAIVFSEQFIESRYESILFKELLYPVLRNQIRLPEFLQQKISWCDEVLELCNEIREVYEKKERFYPLEIHVLLCKVWKLLVLQGKQEESIKNDHLEEIKQVLHYIDVNYADKITLEELARICMMSREHFERIFFKIMHLTPFVYLIDVRLKKSLILLKDSRLSIAEIAQNCGFTDSSYYARTFKKKYGRTPLSYRNAESGFRSMEEQIQQ